VRQCKLLKICYIKRNKSLDTLFQIVNTELELVAECFSDNRLTVNLDKTNYILFKSHRKTGSSHGHHKICINSISLSRVSSTRFLGVYVDQHLDWKDHINNISSKVARNAGILARASHFLPQTVKIKITCHFFRDILSATILS